ncbi:pyridoxal phosphate-dependent transferase [Catenaria anguillulae PL171]|uniref:sphinganine-1-phosphate aldolase n=1 Tax=Catenaria anguillulae PL171 TaxID=765915 RepID=A0A1Y2HBT6_9FUNG|nr:pyridoxal phosphate-dependent transferase [Catenaria anguillulae PL171]
MDTVTNALAASGPRPLRAIKNILFVLFCLRILGAVRKSLVFRGLAGSLKHLLWTISKHALSSVRSLPTPAGSLINQQIQETLAGMEKSMCPPPKPGDPAPYLTLPPKGLNRDALRKEIARYRSMGHVDYKSGKVSGAVYHGGDDLSAIITEAYGAFSSSNPLHPDLFPGVRKMEAEVVRMVVDMYHGGQAGCGNLTSGGTESILMACKAYRELAFTTRGITEPEMIVPDTIHAAFDKACHYFKIKLVKIPIDSRDFRVRLDLVERAINSNTIMLAGSAPNFPHGIIDDIQGLSKLAIKHKLPLHVDCCLGSFLMACMNDAGFSDIPAFDFRVPGVTSMSVDTHKYGFAPKGSSVIMYRNSDYRKHQYFVAPDWTGGIYASPSIAGSRPGALIAGCWATMLSVGRDGYVDATRKIVGTARAIANAIRNDPALSADIEVVGNPLVSVVAIRARQGVKLNIFAVNDVMSKAGWNLNALQFPEALHIACTYLTVGKEGVFVEDLKKAVREVKEHPEKYKDGSAAMYGMAASIPDRSIVADIVTGYLDLMLKP